MILKVQKCTSMFCVGFSSCIARIQMTSDELDCTSVAQIKETNFRCLGSVLCTCTPTSTRGTSQSDLVHCCFCVFHRTPKKNPRNHFVCVICYTLRKIPKCKEYITAAHTSLYRTDLDALQIARRVLRLQPLRSLLLVEKDSV